MTRSGKLFPWTAAPPGAIANSRAPGSMRHCKITEQKIMAPVPPKRVKAILDTALRLDEPDRTAYLEAMWRGDESLQTALEQLLEGSGPVAGFLSQPPGGF